MKRKDVINHIRIEAAKYGETTKEALRLYVESRISYQVFQSTIKEGLKMYESNLAKGECHD